jgi:WD40 repeat protein
VNGPSGYTQDGDALDFDLHSGDVVRSVDTGIVRWAKAYAGSSSWSCYGNSVAIDARLADGSIVTAFYAHLSSIEVSVGDQVTAGQEIAKSGASGGGTNSACPSSYGPHLHFALYTNATYTDANGTAVAAADLPATATGSAEPVTSPPYGGTARTPEPWLDCSRHSALKPPPSGEDSSCTDLHAGDVLAYSAGQPASTPGQPTLTPGPAGFSPTGSMTSLRMGHTATLLSDGRVLLAGGTPGPGPDSAELYDPNTGKFSPTGSMAIAGFGHTATLLSDGRVLLTGSSGGSTSAELYDPKTGKFSPAGALTTFRRDSYTATLLSDGRVLIAGGASDASAELFDPKTDTFSRTGSMTVARGGTATLLSDGRVLLAGGTGDASAELYDPKTGTFSPTGSMVRGARTGTRGGHTATLLLDGRVLIAGGADLSILVASAELYDPKTGTFSPTGSMATARSEHTATLLSDGRVLIAGGSDASGDLASAELYDPKTGAFSPAGSMTTTRFGHTATLLSDGRVLIAGGAGGAVSVSAELYQP